MRPSADALVEAVLVLSTLGAPERRRLRDRKPRPAEPEPDPEPVPTSRATVVHAAPLPDAAAWLAGLRADPEALDEEVQRALGTLNSALRAHRAAAADPYVAEVSPSRALVVRIGYGTGDEVADGRWQEAVAVPSGTARRVRRSMEAPEERFAALLSGREELLPAEELVLRARADLSAGRPREAALQARVAIEALLAALGGAEGIEAHRQPIAAAANAALHGDLPGNAAAALEDAVAAMEAALKRRRLGA